MSRKPTPAPRERARARTVARQPLPAGDRKVHFFLTDAYLVAANTGRPLTQSGLNALCLIGRSAKETMRQRVRPVDPPAEMDMLDTVRERWLQAFEADPERIARDAAREAELAAGLADQLYLEMMQNANDASAAGLPRSRNMLLGQAGKGFRAALSVTDQPRIHSGDVSFTFDPRRAHKAIKKRVGRGTPTEIPVFRLPFPCSAKDEPEPIRALIDEYDTVVVMPFRSLKACERGRTGWDKAVDDVTLIKGLPAINLVVWERDDATAQYKRTIRDNVDRSIQSADEGRKPGPVELVVRGPGAGQRSAAKRTVPTVTRTITRRPRPAKPAGPRVTLSAEVMPHDAAAAAKPAAGTKKANGSAAKPKARATAKSRKTTNGKSASNTAPRIDKSATTARVSVSEKGVKKPAAKKPSAKKPARAAAKTAAKKPAAKKPAAKSAAKKPAAKKPTQKAAASTTKTRTAKAPARKQPAAKKPAAAKTAAKKPAAKKPATKSKAAGATKPAAKKPATKKATAKPRTSRSATTKSRSKSKASTKKS